MTLMSLNGNKIGKCINSIKDRKNVMDKKSVVYFVQCEDYLKVYIGLTGTLLEKKLSYHKSNLKERFQMNTACLDIFRKINIQ